MKFWQLGRPSSLGARIIIILTCSSILVTTPPLNNDSKKKGADIRDNKLTPKNPSIQ